MVYGTSISIENYAAYHNYWYSTRYDWLDSAIMAMNPLGDINVDGLVDVGDVTALIGIVLNQPDIVPWSADINDDGIYDVSDVTALISLVLNH